MTAHRERQLIRKLMGVARDHLRGFLLLRHEDRTSSGIPDISCSGMHATTWWEVKHATPDFRSEGIQELTCLRLDNMSACRYVIYYEDEAGKSTLIVRPKNLKTLTPEAIVTGHNHVFVAQQMLYLHAKRAERWTD